MIESLENIEGKVYRWGLLLVAIILVVAVGAKALFTTAQDKEVAGATTTFPEGMSEPTDVRKGLNEVAIARAPGKTVMTVPGTEIRESSSVEQTADESTRDEQLRRVGDGSGDSLRRVDTRSPQSTLSLEDKELEVAMHEWVLMAKEIVFPGVPVKVRIEVSFSSDDLRSPIYGIVYYGNPDGLGIDRFRQLETEWPLPFRRQMVPTSPRLGAFPLVPQSGIMWPDWQQVGP
ncbi:MAG: hypothetical protein V1763_01130 [Parcubacteria group bacterium]